MTAQPWVRVRDKRTKHTYDVRKDRVNEEKHEVITRAGESWISRPAKPFRSTRKTSAPKADEGGSPDQSASS